MLDGTSAAALEIVSPAPTANDTCRPFVTLQEFADELGVSLSTLRSMRADGRAPPVVRISKRLLAIRRVDKDHWWATRERRA